MHFNLLRFDVMASITGFDPVRGGSKPSIASKYVKYDVSGNEYRIRVPDY